MALRLEAQPSTGNGDERGGSLQSCLDRHVVWCSGKSQPP